MGEKNVLLIGAGGVGTIVAYGIEYVGKAKLSIVVRRDYKKVVEHGYDITSTDYGEVKGWKPDVVYSSVEEAAKSGIEFDFVVITTKNLPEITKVEELVEPVVTPKKTGIVLIQNGFDLGRPFFAKYPENVVISGVTNIGSHNANGVIHQTQKDRNSISYFDNKNLSAEVQKQKALEFIDLYSNEHNEIDYQPNYKYMRYKKLVYNATLNTTCTLTGTDTGRLDNSGTLDSVVVPAMREVVAVAKADGVDLPEDTINVMIHSDDGDYFEPSMLVDSKKGNPLELQVILGNLLTVAKELKVETPTLTLLYNLLTAVQYRLMEKNGYITLPEKRPIVDRYFS